MATRPHFLSFIGSLQVRCVSAAESQTLDEKLFSLGYKSEQLMELAGLSVARCVHKVYGPELFRRVLVIAGPGNNGGDGLVAARHLTNYGYEVEVVCPKIGKGTMISDLVSQARDMNIPIHQSLPETISLSSYPLIIDAIFGYNFKNETIRPPFDNIIHQLASLPSDSSKIVSVDVPSGWPVDDYETLTEPGLRIIPHVLISLGSPKPCSIPLITSYPSCIHYLSSRFIPPSVSSFFQLLNEDVGSLRMYEGTDDSTRLVL